MIQHIVMDFRNENRDLTSWKPHYITLRMIRRLSNWRQWHRWKSNYKTMNSNTITKRQWKTASPGSPFSRAICSWRDVRVTNICPTMVRRREQPKSSWRAIFSPWIHPQRAARRAFLGVAGKEKARKWPGQTAITHLKVLNVADRLLSTFPVSPAHRHMIVQKIRLQKELWYVTIPLSPLEVKK